jgi:hypothetical protein
MMTQTMSLWIQIGLLAFLGSLAVSGFMVVAGLGDSSDERSSHSGTIPTSGGVGVLAGMGAALCALSVLFPDVNLPKGFAPVISLVFAIGMLGLVDDALTLGAKTKFGIMLLISVALGIRCDECREFYGRRKWHDGLVPDHRQHRPFWGRPNWRFRDDAFAIGPVSHDDIGVFTL